MTDERVPAIPSDLQALHRVFSTGKNVRPTAEECVKLIERIAALEAANADLTAQVEALSKPVSDEENPSELEILREGVSRISAFLVGNGDVAEVAARHLRALISARIAPKEYGK